MNAMRATDLRRVFELECATLEDGQECIDLLEQNVAGIAQQQRVGRVDHIGRRKTVMYETRGVPDRFRQIGRKRDDVVVGGLLDFVDAFDGELCAALNLFQRVARDRAHLSVNFTDRKFHLQPLLELILL